MNNRLLTYLLLVLMVASVRAHAQLISVDVLGVGVDTNIPGAATGGDDDLSALSLDALNDDSIFGSGLSGQDILLLGAPAEPLGNAPGSDSALAPLLNNIGGDSPVIEFLQETAGGEDITPEILTIDLSGEDESGLSADASSDRLGEQGQRESAQMQASSARQCEDADGDSVCDDVDSCLQSPKGAVVLPSGCHFDGRQALELRGVSFATGTALLDTASGAVLRQAARILKSAANVPLSIEVAGYTDDRGDEESNMRLSVERALAVIDFLIAEGVAAERLHAVGYGESRPKESLSGLSGAALDAARAKNRRVELRAIPAGGK